MNLAQNLFDTAEQFPNRTGIVFYDKRITYQEMRDFTARLAGALADRGVGPGVRLAIALPNVPEFVFTYYATLAAGGAIVPINPLYTAREMDFMLRNSGARFIVTHPMFEQAVREAIKDKDIELIYSDNLGDPAKECLRDLVASADTMAPIDRQPDDTAVIAYTNATMGWPVGAELTHHGLNFNVTSCRHAAMVDEHDAFLSVIPLYHAFSATSCMNLPIANGAMLILNETFSEKRVVDILENEPISVFPAVPTIFLKMYEVFGGAGKDFSSVKAFVPGGAPCGVDLIQKFTKAFNANVYEGYGITECGPVTTVNSIREKISKIGSIGLALDGISLKICDPKGKEVPHGVRGELCVKGDNVIKSYWNNPEMTAKYLKDGWFYTGDQAWMDEENFVFWTGLIKRMVLVGGFNVYPEEVERIIHEHPAIEKCTVFGAEDVSMGQHVAVNVTLKHGMKLTNIELKKFVRANLAPYKMPRTIDIQEQ
jgi:long-chain acyl-CoA synthetase